jgi:DNA-binding transcriptional ArsR family regulator
MNSQAKRETYLHQIESGKIRSKTVRVLYHLQKMEAHPGLVTTDIMRDVLGYSHQTLTAILSSLQDAGLIKIIGTVRSDRGVYSSWKYVSDVDERERLAELRHQEKYNLWLKRGVEEFHDLLPHHVLNSLHLYTIPSQD